MIRFQLDGSLLRLTLRGFALILILGCGPLAQAQLIVAHRGASRDAPENTLAAFRLAWERGADGVEGDFCLTRDGHIVCIHDKDTQRVAGKNMVVAQSSLAELKRLDVGRWKGPQWKGERIPTLEEVIDTLPPEKLLFIELKVGPEIVAPLKTQLVRSGLAPERYVVISFRSDTIAACEQQITGVKTHWLSGQKQPQGRGEKDPSPKEIVATLRHARADGFGSQAFPEVFDADSIRYLKRAGWDTFHVWTVDDVPTARFYQSQGVYGITTNRPGYLRAGLAEANAAQEGKR